ncbi:MAG TPA: TraU family protein, partial [Syntrophorhabdaceae bacterium]|nr:TraU family protein [Syntrophorhabdaceae bacterium]
GHVNNGYYVQDNAPLAGRMIYKMSREGLMWDTAVNECAPTPMPIWIKEHYRMQMMKPVADYTCHPIGRSGLIWAAEKNPPYGTGTNASGNFDWLTFRKKLCCIGWDWSGGIGY